jgi:hypothetical protein
MSESSIPPSGLIPPASSADLDGAAWELRGAKIALWAFAELRRCNDLSAEATDQAMAFLGEALARLGGELEAAASGDRAAVRAQLAAPRRRPPRPAELGDEDRR